jgi:hypothetical protein
MQKSAMHIWHNEDVEKNSNKTSWIRKKYLSSHHDEHRGAAEQEGEAHNQLGQPDRTEYHLPAIEESIVFKLIWLVYTRYPYPCCMRALSTFTKVLVFPALLN